MCDCGRATKYRPPPLTPDAHLHSVSLGTKLVSASGAAALPLHCSDPPSGCCASLPHTALTQWLTGLASTAKSLLAPQPQSDPAALTSVLRFSVSSRIKPTSPPHESSMRSHPANQPPPPVSLCLLASGQHQLFVHVSVPPQCSCACWPQVTSSLAQKNESLASQYKKSQQQLKEALSATERAGLMIKDLKREVRRCQECALGGA